MITEDYVSFEVAKLLKEKGFEGFCEYRYIFEPDYSKPVFAKKPLGYGAQDKYLFDAPTLQMAVKWFRKVHNIDICTCRELDEYGKCFDGYIAVVYQDGYYKVTIRETTKDLTYEEAANKAIKYSLTLIQ